MNNMKMMTAEEMEKVSGGCMLLGSRDWPHYCPDCGAELIVHTRDPICYELFYWEVWCPKCDYYLNSYEF